MKIFKFVEVATQSHRHEETGGFFKVLRGERSCLCEQRRVRMTSEVSKSTRSHFIPTVQKFWYYSNYTLQEIRNDEKAEKNPAGAEQKCSITMPSSGKFKTKCMYEIQYTVLQDSGG